MGQDAGYGKHPTVYGNLSDGQLYRMYMTDTWKGLDECHRQQLLQETVNRSAMAHGELGACKVVFSRDLDRGTDGVQSGNTIRLDYEKFVNDRQIGTYNGQQVYRSVIDSNIQALTTVFHEDEHAWQNQVIDGIITGNTEALTREYRANNFTLSLVQQNGSQQIGSQYLKGKSNYYLYYLQSTERDAFRNSEAKTVKVMEYLQGKYGNDPSFTAYQAELKANGYDSILQMAQQYFQNENIEKDINQTLMNQYYNTNVPVNEITEAAVKYEMVRSYQAQYMKDSINNNANCSTKNVINNSVHNCVDHTQKGETMGGKVDFANLRVTKEEYDQSLRDTVNAYYEHALRDPNMTQEEAIEETGKMAETYLNAVDEFPDNPLSEVENPDIADAMNALNSDTGMGSENSGLGLNDSGLGDSDGGFGSNDGGLGGDGDGGGGLGGDGGGIGGGE